ncbi:RNA 2',3'-cyclic phosphodiesterase [Halobacteriovorax sp. ZH4_bin.1]|uniref:RNA 2',3'-cyclic phosphodiesterase n=1 Tax=unclassified Halobacteriovorax TaxID=2639665 RepID=UPI003720AFB6
MRVFVAIDLPKVTKEKLENVKMDHAKFRRYPSTNLHLTLKFIGEVSNESLEQIKLQLKKIEFTPFILSFLTLGHFYPHRRGTPIWIGVENNEELIKLQVKVEERLQSLELNLDKMKFTPHLTLGRMERGISEDEVKEFIKTLHIPEFSIEAKEFILFHSHSTKNGVEYLPLETF